MKKIEKVITKYSGIYRICSVDETGNLKAIDQFRVRRRVKINGKWSVRCQTFNSFTEAKIFRNSPHEKPPLESQSSHKFSEVFERFLHHKGFECHLCPSTMEQYRKLERHLRFFNGLKMVDINSRIVDGWCNYLGDPEYKALQKANRITYKKEYTLIAGVFGYYREYENNEFPIPLLKRHRRRLCSRPRSSIPTVRFLTDNQTDAFLSTIRAYGAIYLDIAWVQVRTGMRIGELLGLEKRHLCFERNEIRIEQHLYFERKANAKILVLPGTKSGPFRTVPMTDDCRQILLARMAMTSSTKVFEGNDHWINYRKVQHVYEKTFEKLGLVHSGTHVLRHTFAVAFLDRTKDIHALQLLLGHSDLKTTQVYAKYTNAAVKRAFNSFNDHSRNPNLEVNIEGDVSPLVSRPQLKVVAG